MLYRLRTHSGREIHLDLVSQANLLDYERRFVSNDEHSQLDLAPL